MIELPDPDGTPRPGCKPPSKNKRAVHATGMLSCLFFILYNRDNFKSRVGVKVYRKRFLGSEYYYQGYSEQGHCLIYLYFQSQIWAFGKLKVSIIQKWPGANKAAHSGFETQRRRHQKSKTGASVAQQKDMCPPKILYNKKWVYLNPL